MAAGSGLAAARARAPTARLAAASGGRDPDAEEGDRKEKMANTRPALLRLLRRMHQTLLVSLRGRRRREGVQGWGIRTAMLLSSRLPRDPLVSFPRPSVPLGAGRTRLSRPRARRWPEPPSPHRSRGRWRPPSWARAARAGAHR